MTNPEQPIGEPAARRRNLAEIVVHRPVAVIMVACLIVVFGLVSYQRLPLALMPDISYPTITVRTEYPGAAPEEVETVISRPLEQALGVVNHLVRISSTSRAEASDVVLEFAWGTDMREAAQDIREQLERVRFPEEVDRPLILRYDPSLDPIMRVALWGDADLFTLRRIAEDDVERSVESVDGVAAVRVRGGLEQEILVEVSEEKLALLGLNIGQVAARLRQENINLSGGQLREGLSEYLVRTLNEFRDLDDIRELAVGEREGVPIRLADIAVVRSTNREREMITRIGGKESTEIDIYKEGDANIVRVADQVRARLLGTAAQQAYIRAQATKATRDTSRTKPEALEQAMTNFVARRLPPRVHLDIVSDQSAFIKASIDEVIQTAVLGGILAVIILYLFLRNVPHTLIVAVSIPVSIVATFAAMYLGKVSLNIMSLGGLALGVGMLVDNSIVVLESIFRCREEGDDFVSAAIRGTSEVNTAVTASTFTTIAVFLPIVFVEGVAGQVFGDLSLAVVFSLLASLAVAVWFIPMLASRRVTSGTREAPGVVELTGRLRGEHVVRLPSLSSAMHLKDRFTSEHDVLSLLRISGLLLAHVLLVPLDVVGHVIGTLAAALLVAVRALVVLVSAIIWPAAAPLWRRWRSEESYAAAVGRWSAAESWWRFGRLTGRIWPSLLAFRAAEELRQGMYAARSWTWHGRSRRTAVRATPGIALALLLVVRFVAHLAIELVGKLAMLVAILLLLVVIGVIGLIGLALLPIFALLAAGFAIAYRWMATKYPRLIRWSLRHRMGPDDPYRGPDNRVLVIAIAAGLFVVAGFVILPRFGQELIPQVHEGEFFVDVTMPVGTPIEGTDRVVARIEEMARAVPGVARVAATVGVEKTAAESAERGENTGRVTVVLAAASGLAVEEARAMEALRSRMSELSNVEARMALPVLFSFKTPVEVEIRGFDLERLKGLSQEAQAHLARLPGFRDVESNIQLGNPEVRISYDRRRLVELGLSPYDVATLIRTKIAGTVATKFRDENVYAGEERRIDVRVQLAEEDKAFVENLGRIVINPGQRVPLPLSAVAQIKVAEGPSEIRRIGQQRAAVVSANLDGIDLATATELIHGALREMDWPVDMSYTIGGQNAEMQTSLKSLYFALALAVFLVYVVMASQFESFLHPFVIMFTMPLALIGVVFLLWALSVPLSVVVFLGIIILVGIVVNNAIVLIDYVNQLRHRGISKHEALVQAGMVRLRPILMTTLTTVLGLAPMALGLGEGAEIRTPMALTVIAGLTSSTILTLIVIPTVYSLLDRKP